MTRVSQFERQYFQIDSVYNKFLTTRHAVIGLANYYFGFYNLLKKNYLQNIVSHGRILELGCGYSGLIPHFLADGYEYVGLDVSNYIIEEMVKIYPSVTLINHDIQDPLKDVDQFDLAIALEVLEHIPNVALGLKNVFNLISPGGLFLATVPNPRSKIPLTDWRRDPTHVTIFPKEEWINHLKNSGFSKVEATTIFSVPYFWRYNKRFSKFFKLPEYGASILLSATR